MEPATDRPTLWHIRGCLFSSLDHADMFAHNRPEFADAVTRFTREVRRIKKELITSFEEDLVLAPLHDIVNGLTGAKGMASIMAEHHPEKSDAINRFVKDLNDAQQKSIREVRPDVSPPA